MKLAIFPEGPIAFDGQSYRYSKGERLYIDNLAQDFDEIVLVAFTYKRNHADYMACSHSAFTAKNIRVIELPFEPDKNYSVIAKLWHFMSVFWHIGKSAKYFDVGYLFLPSYPSAMAWFVCLLLRKPYFVYAASDWQEVSETMFKWPKYKQSLFYQCFYKLNGWLEKKITQGARFTVAAGKSLLTKLSSYTTLVFETIPRFTLSLEDVFVRNDTCLGTTVTLITVGDLIPRKRVDLIIKTFAELAAEFDYLRLKIVGMGPLLPELTDLATTLKVENKIEFTGYIEQEHILYQHYRDADIYVLASTTEGFPRVLYEAMAQSLPIISTACGGVAGIIKHNQSGLLVPVAFNNELAIAIRAYLTESELRKQVIATARNQVIKILQERDSKQIKQLVAHYIS